jgi:hypothetical protein
MSGAKASPVGRSHQTMIRRASFCIILSLAVFCSKYLSQRAPSLQGIVVEAGSGTPIMRANVELRSALGPPGNPGPALARTHSDRDGKFVFPTPPSGRYRVVVNHAGHVPAELTPDQGATNVRIAMTAGGVVSGRLTDKGQPIGLADAVALRAIYTEGQLSLTPVLAVRTDDLGEFHLFWLPPGRYYIVGVSWDIANSVPRYINPEGDNSQSFWAQRYIGRAVFLRATAAGVGENEAHIPIYYPGTPDPQMARAIDVQPGAVIRGIDIDTSAVPTRRVSGRVAGMPASTRGQVNMRPLSSTFTTSATQTPAGSVDANGNFDIPSVAPGRYILTATAGNLTGRSIVEVRDRDVSGVGVAFLPAINVPGRVVVERTGAAVPNPAIPGLRVVLRTDPLVPGAPTYGASQQPDGSFTIASAPPGDYRVLVTSILVSVTPPDTAPAAIPATLQNVYVKSVRMGDVDVLNDRLHLDREPQDPLIVVLGTNPGSLSGRVLNDNQQPFPGATVVLVHSNGLRYRVNEKVASSDASGRFSLQNVPPGDYKLFAWQAVERGAWQDPNFMRDFESRGVALQIEEGRETSTDVRVIEK